MTNEQLKTEIIDWLQGQYNEVHNKLTSYLNNNNRIIARYQAEARIYSKVIEHIANIDTDEES